MTAHLEHDGHTLSVTLIDGDYTLICEACRVALRTLPTCGKPTKQGVPCRAYMRTDLGATTCYTHSPERAAKFLALPRCGVTTKSGNICGAILRKDSEETTCYYHSNRGQYRKRHMAQCEAHLPDGSRCPNEFHPYREQTICWTHRASLLDGTS